MSERLGPRTFGHKEEMVFLGREISEQRDYSEKVAEEIDDEVRRIIDKAYHTAKQICQEYRPKLDVIADRLVEDETLEGAELRRLLGDGEVAEPETQAAPAAPTDEVEPAKGKRAMPKIPPKPGLAWGSGATTFSDRPEA